ncbi:sigma E protease regulator RseP [Muribacter muris]|uniref:Zinc metalloprotease n=1 Tax=Muribacter muris TaxID=67855 RepID=A0A4Y9K5L2_9PAST|nr:sigma E protease regulator RseP [Muribacter muris]MBF0784514.1 sigma E protease regulator RseP [Muribacter muris]MBF0826190.1 sigma E protease regulator RseP [Muribacter muris]TFV12027.1 sigma E protease regulator RseP [Muribacter muris]
MTSIVAFFILICVLVFVHEYGHFWAARKCGVKVLRFSIGFGKVLWRKKDKHGTEFAFSLIPLGGYVQMYNGEPELNLPIEHALKHKSLLQRAAIIAAGPIANFLFAIVAYWAVFSLGVPTVKPVIGEVLPDSIAAQAQLTPEFEITHIDGREVRDWEDVTLTLVGKVGSNAVELKGYDMESGFPAHASLDLSGWQVDGNKQNPLTALGIRPKSSVIEPIIKGVVENSPAAQAGLIAGDRIIRINQQPFDWAFLVEQVQTGEPLVLEIERQGVEQSVSIQPEKKEKRYLIGIQPSYQPLEDKYRTELKYDMLTALEKSLSKVWALIDTILQFIGHLITGQLSLSNMGGPISMAKGAGATAEIGFVYYLGFMALISVNLGVMNLFPILPLDGGQLVLLAGEAIRRKPIAEKIQLRFQQLGIVFVLSLMAFALFNDLIHF